MNLEEAKALESSHNDSRFVGERPTTLYLIEITFRKDRMLRSECQQRIKCYKIGYTERAIHERITDQAVVKSYKTIAQRKGPYKIVRDAESKILKDFSMYRLNGPSNFGGCFECFDINMDVNLLKKALEKAF